MLYQSKFIFAVLFVVVLLGSGCNSVSMMYDYGNFSIRWQVNNYFDTTSEQDNFLETRLAHHLELHKRQVLPQYILFLTKVEQMGQTPFQLQELEWLYTEIEKERDRITASLVPDVAQFLTSLDANQLAYFRETAQEENQEVAEELALPLAQRRQEMFEKMEKKLENWFGELTKEQQQLIQSWNREDLAEKNDPLRRRLNYRKQRLTQFLTLMESSPSTQQVEQWLTNWMKSHSASENTTEQQQQRRNRSQQRILAFATLLTSEQRQGALAELRDYLQQMQEIQSEAFSK